MCIWPFPVRPAVELAIEEEHIIAAGANRLKSNGRKRQDWSAEVSPGRVESRLAEKSLTRLSKNTIISPFEVFQA
ncbi:MAG TPA: hypothetical protein VLE20_03715 [Blastocatellia bacterium]|nr:hypothetical protein [Blastocatellia bacterium]